jgi:hypothetical protein
VRCNQAGATAVEFALVLVTFLAVTLGILDFARMLFTWSSANEAARAGARYAAVCDNTASAALVLAKMRAVAPQVQAANIGWDPPGCSPTSCIGVRVTITGMNYNFMSPLAGLARVGAIPMPNFATYLTREDMRQDPNYATICP